MLLGTKTLAFGTNTNLNVKLRGHFGITVPWESSRAVTGARAFPSRDVVMVLSIVRTTIWMREIVVGVYCFH